MERAVVFLFLQGRRDSDDVSSSIIATSSHRYLTIHSVPVKFLPEKRIWKRGVCHTAGSPVLFMFIFPLLFRLLMKADASTVSSGAYVLLSLLL